MLKIFKRLRCGHCNSGNIDKGYYHRGWNNLCEQAYGNDGWFCNKCFNISWSKTYEEAVKAKKDWCTIYKNTTVTIKFKQL